METKKQEAIRLAYGKNWEIVKGFIDKNGWCVQIDYSTGTEIKNHPPLMEMGFHKDDGLLDCGWFPDEQKHKWRPKSIQSIEDNNGWVSIDENFEWGKYNEYLRFWDNEGKQEVISLKFSLCANQKLEYKKRFTHYKEIEKSQPPIF